MSRPRRSRTIALVLIGTTALPACMPAAPRVVHDRYASLADCSADWGRPEVCDRDDDSRPLPGNYGGPRVVYSGPSYPLGDRGQAQYEARTQALQLGALQATAPGTGNRAIEQSVPTRAGFGSSAHFFGRLG
jgi:uncharacterized protein YgiB involved in biofilm formation